MSPPLKVVRSTRELAADEAKAKLTAYLYSLPLSYGQKARVLDMVDDYGARRFEVGFDRGEHVHAPKGDAAA